MLKPAQLYEDKLNEKYIGTWYDPKYMYYTGGTGARRIQIPDNNYDNHEFVSVDNDDEVIGFLSYRIDWQAKCVSAFGLINFGDVNTIFSRDMIQAIYDIFNKYHMNRLSWYCFADNPAIKIYRKFIERHGGIQCGYLRQDCMLRDGKLHDSVLFEILSKDFK